jgi:DNA polymerase-1
MPVVYNPDLSNGLILSDKIALDIETSGLKPWEEKIELIAICNQDGSGYIINCRNYPDESIKQLFLDISLVDTVVAHNAKFECSFIYANYGILLRNWWCTQLASQILLNGKDGFLGKHGLLDVLERTLNIKHEFNENKKLYQLLFTKDYRSGEYTDRQLEYAWRDVDNLIAAYNVQHNDIADLHLGKIIRLENTLLPILAKMEVEGILIDKESWLNIIKTKWEPKLHEIEERLDAEVGRLTGNETKRNKQRIVSFDLFGFHSEQVISNSKALNYSSALQIMDLFQRVGEKVPLGEGKDPEGPRPSVDDLALTKYCNENPDSRLTTFIDILKEYREQDKLLSTYGQKFLDQLDHESKIHTQYTQTFTKTGRLSSKSPNLQNIPAPEKDKPDNDVRQFFIARPGYKLITCDMAAAEVRIAADYSGEQVLLDSLLNGSDMHSLLASVSFSIIFGESITVSDSGEEFSIGSKSYVLKELRKAHKSVVFAKFYKAGAKRIYSTLASYINPFHPNQQERLEIASKISKALDERMPRLSSYLNGMISKAQKDGYLRTSKLGRIRYFNSDVYGEAANAPIQGTNAEAIKIAMIRCFNKFQELGLDARVAMNVHDELVVEAREDIAEEVALLTQDIMANSLSYFLTKIEGKSTVEIANNWKK